MKNRSMMNLKTIRGRMISVQRIVFTVGLMLAGPLSVFAQDEGPEGPPPVPVNKYLLLLAIMGVVVAWFYLKNRSFSKLPVDK